MLMCSAFLCIICLALLARAMLIMLGLLKGPVLRSLERYGDDELLYNVLPQALLWMGLSVAFGGFWLQESLALINSPLPAVGIFILILAGLSFQYERSTAFLFRYPAWYHELLRRTSRSERRRIAYMWLRLSWKTQLLYNSNDRAFLQWADFIILATINP